MASDTQAQNSPTPEVPENHGALVAMGNRASQLPAVPWPYGGPMAVRPDILSASPTPIDLLQSLRRRWPLAVGLGMLLSGVLASVVWFLVPVRFEAQSLIKVSKVLPVVLQNVYNGGSDVEGAAYDIYKKTQLQLVRSNFVLSRATRKPEMVALATMKEHKDDPVGFLESKLIVDYPGDAELMRLSIKGTRREDLPVIINSIVDSYMDEIVSGDQVARLKQKDLLSQNYSTNQEAFRQKSDKFKKLTRDLGASSSEAAQMRKRLFDRKLESMVSSRNSLLQRIRDQKLQIKVMEDRKAKGESPAVAVPPHLIEQEYAHDPIILEYTKQLSMLKLQIKEQEALSANLKHWPVTNLKRQLATLDEQIQSRRLELEPEVIARLAAIAPGGHGYDFEGMLPMLKSEQEMLEENLTLATEDLERQLKEYEKLDTDTADLTTQESQLDDLRAIIKRVGTQLALWNLELEAEQRIKVLDKASRPQGDDSMQKYLGVGFAGFVGFGVVLFGVAYIEFQSRRLNSATEVKEGLGLPVVGELPTLSGRTWRKIRSGSPAGVALEALLSESVDSIRTRLLHASGIESPRVIMVTSADPREGKTTVAIQLATSLARSGRRTLLIDGDVRNPAVHRVFELAIDPGLCEILRGDVERAVALQPSRTPQLWVLAAGRCCLQSVQALSQSALQDLLTTLRSEFEFIIIDTSPVLKLADPLLFGQHVDVALLSVLRDVSKTPQIYEATERLKSVGITVLGTVINGVGDGSQRYSSANQLALPEKAAGVSS
jgi:capsular exopolysaccharide synthesis family protein